jgi:cytochrome b561
MAAAAAPPDGRTARYSSGAMIFHWTIALLIVGNILGAILTEDMEGAVRGLAMGLHKATGITILVLSLARLGWRIAHPPPPLPASVGRGARLVSRLVHWAFYGLMIGLPLTGWAMISASSPRRPFMWYGLFDLPFLPVEGNKAVGVFAHDAHELLFYGLLVLLALHLAGAFRHHFRDGRTFLFRMMPGQRRA